MNDRPTTAAVLARCASMRRAALLPLSVLAAAAANAGPMGQGGVAAGAEPQVLAAAPATPIQVPEAKADTVVLQKLEGLVFLPGLAQVSQHGTSRTGVDASRVPVLETPEFHALAGAYIGKRLTLADLQHLTEQVVAFCRQHDRPVVDVMVPEQDVTSGTVQIVVLEGRLGTVSTVNNRWFDSTFLASAIRLQAGEPVSARTLQEDLAWLNRNPFRQVDAVFVQGKEPGTTDVQLQVQERYPLRVYASYENSGNRYIGDGIYSAGLNWGNVFDTDQQLGYQYDRSSHDGALEAHHLTYTAPLPWRHILSLSADYVETDSDLLNAFGLTGRSTRVGARYWMPLPQSSIKGLEQAFQGGLDYKRSNNNLEFFGNQIFDQSADVVQLALRYEGSLPDVHGVNNWYGSVALSPGGLTGDNKDERFEAMRAGAEAQYAYADLGYGRLTRLPHDFTWALNTEAQLSSARLLPSEEFGLGGHDTVRGFEERETSGDNGVLVSNELRTPSWTLPGDSWFAKNSEYQFLAFFDWGQVGIHSPEAGEKSHQSLGGTGLGVRYRLGNYVVAQADYGWQVFGKDNDPESDSQAHVRIMASY